MNCRDSFVLALIFFMVIFMVILVSADETPPGGSGADIMNLGGTPAQQSP